MTPNIRPAVTADIPHIIRLLHQVDMVHHQLRPDLFKPHTTKYSAEQLAAMMTTDSQPIFVFDDGNISGYVFCQVQQVQNDRLLKDRKTLYIDDLCVDETARGKHIGRQLFDYVREYAQAIGCQAITLNVWEGNNAALAFYRKLGMNVRKTCMEMVL